MEREIIDYRKKIENGEKVEDVVRGVYERIGDDPYGVFISLNKDAALARAGELDKKEKDKRGRLFGLPILVKDNILTEGLRTTCASKMLEDYIPSYSASLVKRLEEEDAVIIGKTNMDEFAMGSNSESSYFHPTKNPIDPSLSPGGSSSGSGTGQRLGYAFVSIGTDTGGSVRQPASFSSIIGYKPSYGLISRYGVVSMANTLDQVGIFSNNIIDLVSVLNVIGGYDELDDTSIRRGVDFKLEKFDDLNGIRVGIVKEEDYWDEKVKEDYRRAIEIFRKLGCEVSETSFKNKKYFSPAYSVISTSEASSNLSRFDGIRYGYLAEDYDDLNDLYKKTRSIGFGEEVQRRIAMGMYYLGSSFDRKIYEKALTARKLIVDELEKSFESFDIILSPSATSLPEKQFSNTLGTVGNFTQGDYHVLANLIGSPAISLPMNEGIGGSVQLIAKKFDDQKLLSIANRFFEEVR